MSPTVTFSRLSRRESLQARLRVLLQQNDLESAKVLLAPVQPADLAEAIEHLPQTLQVIAFRLLSKTEAIEVYEYLESSVQQSLLEDFKRQDLLEVVDAMSPDDRVRLFDELPAKVVSRLLTQLSPDERQTTALLLGYEMGTAGRIMTPEYISLKENWTVDQALAQIRQLANISETIYYLYVTDPSRQLTGILSLRSLVTAQPDQTIGEIMVQEVIYTQTDTPQEEVARLIQRYDFLAVPVVDTEQRLVGIVTVDDVLDILEAETTKDIYTLGGGVQTGGDRYFQSDLFSVARRRVTWLLILLVTNTATSAVIRSQQEILQQVVALAAFIPLLIGTGGNVGAQSSTVVIRGLNTEEIDQAKAFQVVRREAIAGALLGIMLGLVVLVWAYLLQGNWLVSGAVGISLVAISILASIAGSALPLIFQSLKLDPALMSAPFITTAVDVLGVLIYLNVARFILQV
ncbi:MAG: magnesium transporter [Elainella sp. Prado103]|nr:magnesium transporter [Elainella sp. Prado103]